MGPFRMITSPAAVLLRANIDTDIIAPMRRLLDDMGEMGRFAFEPLRFVDGDGDRGILAPDFPLNQKRGRDARILIVGENFGCGSSREQAAHCRDGDPLFDRDQLWEHLFRKLLSVWYFTDMP